jgi:hypothetical protein
MAFDRKDYGMNSGIPFIKIANRVEVSVNLRWKRISGPPPAFADQSHPRSVYGDAWMNSASTESKYMLTKESTVA